MTTLERHSAWHRPARARHGRDQRRPLTGLVIAVLALGFSVGSMAAATGQEPAPAERTVAVTGVLVDGDGTPVPDALITVTGGDFTGSATTDPEGVWLVELPTAGTFEVALDITTLPEGVSLTDPERATTSLLVFAGKPTKVIFPLGEATAGGGGLAGTVMQLTVDGLLFGLIISLGALGLSLIYGTTGLTNFAHGELIALGALTAYFLNAILGIHIALAALLTVIIVALVGGLVQDRILWRPLRRRGTGLIAMLVISIGLGIFLRYLYLFLFGGRTRQYAQYAGQPGLEFGPVSITPKALVAGAFAILLLAAAIYWLLRTRAGKASRAIADNPSLASASGINVEGVINVVWMIGAGLAAFGGIMLGLTQGVSWVSGFQVLLLTFAAVTLGGLGTAFGAIVGSLVVGLFIQLSTLVVPTELKYVGALLLLIVVLLVRPQGILGRTERVG